MTTTPEQPEDIAAIRAELAASIDELANRINPKNAASEAAHTAKQATVDAAAFVSGAGLPNPSEGNRARNAKIAIGAAAGLITVIALSLLSRRRK